MNLWSKICTGFLFWLSNIITHIFQNPKVTSKKNVPNFCYLFLAQFCMLFHVVWSILFRVLSLETTFWLVEIFQTAQPIRSFYLSDFYGQHSEQDGSHHVKEHAKVCRERVSQIVYIFVWGNGAFGKMCTLKRLGTIV